MNALRWIAATLWFGAFGALLSMVLAQHLLGFASRLARPDDAFFVVYSLPFGVLPSMLAGCAFVLASWRWAAWRGTVPKRWARALLAAASMASCFYAASVFVPYGYAVSEAGGLLAAMLGAASGMLLGGLYPASSLPGAGKTS